MIDKKTDDMDVGVTSTEVRMEPGSEHTRIAVVMILANEDRVIYEEEVRNRKNKRMHKLEVRNRKGKTDPVPPSVESVVGNPLRRAARLAELAGAQRLVIKTGEFETEKGLRGETKRIE